LVKTHSTFGAQISKSIGPLPMLLYTPSWSGIRTECTIQIEEMASHGYVVVAIDHPYSSRTVAFPDGRVVHRSFSGEESYASDEAVDAFVKVADAQVRLRAEDASFVLDTLEDLNGNDPEGLLTGALSLDQVGIFGFSLGGGTAAQACATDRRFKAGLDMGGMIAAEAIEQGTFVPFFFMFEGMYESYPYTADADVFSLAPYKRREVEFTRNQFGRMKMSLAKSGGYWMTINGMRHQDFSDAPFFSPLRRRSVNPRKMARILSEFTRTFFDKHLRNLDPPGLDKHISEFPDVHFEVWAQVPPSD
jgi:dienelactone hydrolase